MLYVDASANVVPFEILRESTEYVPIEKDLSGIMLYVDASASFSFICLSLDDS